MQNAKRDGYLDAKCKRGGENEAWLGKFYACEMARGSDYKIVTFQSWVESLNLISL
jgi:hypothetical protein